MWPDRRLCDLFGIEHPIVQAPMAGVTTPELVAAVSEAGGLGSLACGLLTPEEVAEQVGRIRALTNRAFGLNFMCHAEPDPADPRFARWRALLEPYRTELGARAFPSPGAPGPGRRPPFDEAMCAIVTRLGPAVVSFHFGLPAAPLLERVKAAGCRVLASATTVAEARALAVAGVDAVIAQGAEAGGHRGTFLDGREGDMVGTMALVPQVADAVDVPVIAAGGIADGRGIAAALMLGAAGVQMGTAYLLCPEARVSPMHRHALQTAGAEETVVTRAFTGRPARAIHNRMTRELEPHAKDAPPYPLGVGFTMTLREAAEAKASGDFSPLWSGQAARLAQETGAGELTRRLAADALERLGRRLPAD